jgi:hypothetical protein
MGSFSGLGKAKSTQGGNYIKPGNYLLQIKAVKEQKSEFGNRKFFIAEVRVVESKKTDPEIEPNGVDTEPSWLVELPGKYPELALGNIKNFLLAAYGSQAEAEGEDAPGEDDIDEAAAEAAVDEDNPLEGTYIAAQAFQKKTRGGGDFTRINFSIPPNAAELAA